MIPNVKITGIGKEARAQSEVTKISSRIIALLIIFIAASSVRAEEAPVKLVAVLKINKELDRRTAIKPSTIPNAGNGLFAIVPIKKGEVIGELGGRLMTVEDPIVNNHYLASIPQCAWGETKPYRYLDSKNFGGNVSRTNFAPSKINGIETHFQNAAIHHTPRIPLFCFCRCDGYRTGSGDLVELRPAL